MTRKEFSYSLGTFRLTSLWWFAAIHPDPETRCVASWIALVSTATACILVWTFGWKH